MSVKPLFLASDIKCSNHVNIRLSPDEDKCYLCGIAERNLQLKPTFHALCEYDSHQLKKGAYYEVLFIIREGSRNHSREQGYVVREIEGKNKFGGVLLSIYDADRFLPEQYMTDEEKKKMQDKIG